MGKRKTMESLKKKAQAEQALGPLVIVRNLLKEGKTGVVADGVLEKTEPQERYPKRLDYFLRGEDNTLYIVNETKALRDQVGDGEAFIGKRLQIVNNGKITTKSGNGFYDLEVFAPAT